MKQAPGFDGRSFDPFSLFQNGFTAPEVDIGRGEVLQALVIAPVVVMIDKGIDLMPEITGQVVVFQQDAVLQGLVPSIARQTIAKQSAERARSSPEFAGDTEHLEHVPSAGPPANRPTRWRCNWTRCR